MMRRLRRTLAIYGAVASMTSKTFLAYSIWVWVEFFLQIMAMIIFVYFWRAVYAGGGALNGLSLRQTLNYILLAQIILPLAQTRAVFRFGFIIREGQLIIELLRPLDFQAAEYADSIARLGLYLLLKLPLVVIAWLFFGLQLPANPAVWGAFLFFFDWAYASLAFYTTETWGLSVVREGVAAFFSGALVPLAFMPGWLQGVANALPFAQGLYVPISILSGIAPLSDVPRLWLVQIIWLVSMLVASRVIFRVAVRTVTVQGG
ncbi:MAG: hypothetical protein HZB20_06645 [Chloroflexi bacterium]|nr:hypothetical protein [Chloroflexota bacterium]